MKNLLLLSSSRMGSMGYLEHADDQIHTILKHGKQQVLFIPYAGVAFSHDHYESMVKPVYQRLGYDLVSIHHFPDPVAAVEQAEAIAVGGGNTFNLLNMLYQNKLIECIRERVDNGMPYMGWSAGTNVSCPTIRTTNDMPIVAPPSLDALNLVPFQINPHFISGKPVGHNGESREERLGEFLIANRGEELLSLYEGSALYVEGDQGRILGDKAGLWFRTPEQIDNIEPNTSFELSMIKGAK